LKSTFFNETKWFWNFFWNVFKLSPRFNFLYQKSTWNRLFLMKKIYFEIFFEMFASCLHALIFCNKNLFEIDFFNETKWFWNFFWNVFKLSPRFNFLYKKPTWNRLFLIKKIYFETFFEIFAKCLHTLIFCYKNQLTFFNEKKNYFETFFEMFSSCLHSLVFCIKNLLEIDYF
jgi:hypothetical protein